LQNLLLPLCGFLNKLQKDAARLHEVFHIFAFTMKIFRELPDLEFSTKMIKKMDLMGTATFITFFCSSSIL
jgi:hypothetical protein